MTIIKYCFSCVLIALSLSAFSQHIDTSVFLKWKLKPGEVLTYKTVMKEIDTANHKDISIEGMISAVGVKDKVDATELNKVFAQLNKQIQNADLMTRMTETRKGVIGIEMSMVNKEKDAGNSVNNSDPKTKDIQKALKLMTKGVMLRGSVYEDGSIASFYTKNEQRNLVSILFELPAKNIKVGDTWSLDVHLLSTDQYFVCDSSLKKNNVTLISIENKDGEHIATLKYDILEYIQGKFNSPVNNEPISTMMKMTHQAIARFSIEKGRWIFYDGIMSLSSSGLMTSQTTKRLSLITD